MKPGASSSLRAAGYDPRGAILRLTSRSGRIYDYFRVPPQVDDELMSADSKGRYFNHHIRDRFRFREVCDPPGAGPPR